MSSRAGSNADFLRWAFEDYSRFLGLLQIIPKEGQGRSQLIANDVQKQFIRERTGRDIVLKGRQIGFSTAEVARDIWYLITNPGSKVQVVVQSIESHQPLKNIIKMAEVMFESLQKAGVNLNLKHTRTDEWEIVGSDSVLTVIEAGASLASANKKGRSGTINRLHLSELAFYEYAQNTTGAMLQCVPKRELGSEIVIESTPNGATGPFYERCTAARQGDSDFRFHFYPWFMDRGYALELRPGEIVEPRTLREQWIVQNCGVTPEQLKWWRKMVSDNGLMWVEQEYPSDPDTCFLASGRNFFDKEAIQKMQLLVRPPEKSALSGRLSVWQGPRPGGDYAIGVDTSEGTGGDKGAAVVFERGSGRHVATLWGQFRPWDLAKEVVQLAKLYNQAQIAVERAQHGHAVLQALEVEHQYPAIWRDRDGKYGWLNVQNTRTAALDQLEDASRKGIFKTLDSNVVNEMATFIVTETGKAEAAPGKHDDLVMATAIGWNVINRSKSLRVDYGSGF